MTVSIKINQDEVHIWFSKLSTQQKILLQYTRILSQFEILRSKNFVFEEDRNRFLIRHIILRILLSCYLSEKVFGIDFLYNDLGKPVLPKKFKFGFNISHSHEYAVFAFANHKRIGIDIEYCPVNKTFLYTNMQEQPRSREHVEQWVRFEAFFKAEGVKDYSLINELQSAINLDKLYKNKKLKEIKINIIPDYISMLITKKDINIVKIMNFNILH